MTRSDAQVARAPESLARPAFDSYGRAWRGIADDHDQRVALASIHIFLHGALSGFGFCASTAMLGVMIREYALKHCFNDVSAETTCVRRARGHPYQAKQEVRGKGCTITEQRPKLRLRQTTRILRGGEPDGAAPAGGDEPRPFATRPVVRRQNLSAISRGGSVM